MTTNYLKKSILRIGRRARRAVRNQHRRVISCILVGTFALTMTGLNTVVADARSYKEKFKSGFDYSSSPKVSLKQSRNRTSSDIINSGKSSGSSGSSTPSLKTQSDNVKNTVPADTNRQAAVAQTVSLYNPIPALSLFSGSASPPPVQVASVIPASPISQSNDLLAKILPSPYNPIADFIKAIGANASSPSPIIAIYPPLSGANQPQIDTNIAANLPSPVLPGVQSQQNKTVVDQPKSGQTVVDSSSGGSTRGLFSTLANVAVDAVSFVTAPIVSQVVQVYDGIKNSDNPTVQNLVQGVQQITQPITQYGGQILAMLQGDKLKPSDGSSTPGVFMAMTMPMPQTKQIPVLPDADVQKAIDALPVQGALAGMLGQDQITDQGIINAQNWINNVPAEQVTMEDVGAALMINQLMGEQVVDPTRLVNGVAEQLNNIARGADWKMNVDTAKPGQINDPLGQIGTVSKNDNGYTLTNSVDTGNGIVQVSINFTPNETSNQQTGVSDNWISNLFKPKEEPLQISSVTTATNYGQQIEQVFNMSNGQLELTASRMPVTINTADGEIISHNLLVDLGTQKTFYQEENQIYTIDVNLETGQGVIASIEGSDTRQVVNVIPSAEASFRFEGNQAVDFNGNQLITVELTPGMLQNSGLNQDQINQVKGQSAIQTQDGTLYIGNQKNFESGNYQVIGQNQFEGISDIGYTANYAAGQLNHVVLDNRKEIRDINTVIDGQATGFNVLAAREDGSGKAVSNYREGTLQGTEVTLNNFKNTDGRSVVLQYDRHGDITDKSLAQLSAGGQDFTFETTANKGFKLVPKNENQAAEVYTASGGRILPGGESGGGGSTESGVIEFNVEQNINMNIAKYADETGVAVNLEEVSKHQVTVNVAPGSGLSKADTQSSLVGQVEIYSTDAWGAGASDWARIETQGTQQGLVSGQYVEDNFFSQLESQSGSVQGVNNLVEQRLTNENNLYTADGNGGLKFTGVVGVGVDKTEIDMTAGMTLNHFVEMTTCVVPEDMIIAEKIGISHEAATAGRNQESYLAGQGIIGEKYADNGMVTIHRGVDEAGEVSYGLDGTYTGEAGGIARFYAAVDEVNGVLNIARVSGDTKAAIEMGAPVEMVAAAALPGTQTLFDNVIIEDAGYINDNIISFSVATAPNHNGEYGFFVSGGGCNEQMEFTAAWTNSRFEIIEADVMLGLINDPDSGLNLPETVINSANNGETYIGGMEASETKLGNFVLAGNQYGQEAATRINNADYVNDAGKVKIFLGKNDGGTTTFSLGGVGKTFEGDLNIISMLNTKTDKMEIAHVHGDTDAMRSFGLPSLLVDKIEKGNAWVGDVEKENVEFVHGNGVATIDITRETGTGNTRFMIQGNKEIEIEGNKDSGVIFAEIKAEYMGFSENADIQKNIGKEGVINGEFQILTEALGNPQAVTLKGHETFLLGMGVSSEEIKELPKTFEGNEVVFDKQGEYEVRVSENSCDGKAVFNPRGVIVTDEGNIMVMAGMSEDEMKVQGGSGSKAAFQEAGIGEDVLNYLAVGEGRTFTTSGGEKLDIKYESNGMINMQFTEEGNKLTGVVETRNGESLQVATGIKTKEVLRKPGVLDVVLPVVGVYSILKHGLTEQKAIGLKVDSLSGTDAALKDAGITVQSEHEFYYTQNGERIKYSNNGIYTIVPGDGQELLAGTVSMFLEGKQTEVSVLTGVTGIKMAFADGKIIGQTDEGTLTLGVICSKAGNKISVRNTQTNTYRLYNSAGVEKTDFLTRTHNAQNEAWIGVSNAWESGQKHGTEFWTNVHAGKGRAALDSFYGVVSCSFATIGNAAMGGIMWTLAPEIAALDFMADNVFREAPAWVAGTGVYDKIAGIGAGIGRMVGQEEAGKAFAAMTNKFIEKSVTVFSASAYFASKLVSQNLILIAVISASLVCPAVGMGFLGVMAMAEMTKGIIGGMAATFTNFFVHPFKEFFHGTSLLWNNSWSMENAFNVADNALILSAGALGIFFAFMMAAHGARIVKPHVQAVGVPVLAKIMDIGAKNRSGGKPEIGRVMEILLSEKSILQKYGEIRKLPDAKASQQGQKSADASTGKNSKSGEQTNAEAGIKSRDIVESHREAVKYESNTYGKPISAKGSQTEGVQYAKDIIKIESGTNNPVKSLDIGKGKSTKVELKTKDGKTEIMEVKVAKNGDVTFKVEGKDPVTLEKGDVAALTEGKNFLEVTTRNGEVVRIGTSKALKGELETGKTAEAPKDMQPFENRVTNAIEGLKSASTRGEMLKRGEELARAVEKTAEGLKTKSPEVQAESIMRLAEKGDSVGATLLTKLLGKNSAAESAKLLDILETSAKGKEVSPGAHSINMAGVKTQGVLGEAGRMLGENKGMARARLENNLISETMAESMFKTEARPGKGSGVADIGAKTGQKSLGQKNIDSLVNEIGKSPDAIGNLIKALEGTKSERAVETILQKAAEMESAGMKQSGRVSQAVQAGRRTLSLKQDSRLMRNIMEAVRKDSDVAKQIADLAAKDGKVLESVARQMEKSSEAGEAMVKAWAESGTAMEGVVKSAMTGSASPKTSATVLKGLSSLPKAREVFGETVAKMSKNEAETVVKKLETTFKDSPGESLKLLDSVAKRAERNAESAAEAVKKTQERASKDSLGESLKLQESAKGIKDLTTKTSENIAKNMEASYRQMSSSQKNSLADAINTIRTESIQALKSEAAGKKAESYAGEKGQPADAMRSKSESQGPEAVRDLNTAKNLETGKISDATNNIVQSLKDVVKGETTSPASGLRKSLEARPEAIKSIRQPGLKGRIPDLRGKNSKADNSIRAAREAMEQYIDGKDIANAKSGEVSAGGTGGKANKGKATPEGKADPALRSFGDNIADFMNNALSNPYSFTQNVFAYLSGMKVLQMGMQKLGKSIQAGKADAYKNLEGEKLLKADSEIQHKSSVSEARIEQMVKSEPGSSGRLSRGLDRVFKNRPMDRLIKEMENNAKLQTQQAQINQQLGDRQVIAGELVKSMPSLDLAKQCVESSGRYGQDISKAKSNGKAFTEAKAKLKDARDSGKASEQEIQTLENKVNRAAENVIRAHKAVGRAVEALQNPRGPHKATAEAAFRKFETSAAKELVKNAREQQTGNAKVEALTKANKREIKALEETTATRKNSQELVKIIEKEITNARANLKQARNEVGAAKDRVSKVSGNQAEAAYKEFQQASSAVKQAKQVLQIRQRNLNSRQKELKQVETEISRLEKILEPLEAKQAELQLLKTQQQNMLSEVDFLGRHKAVAEKLGNAQGAEALRAKLIERAPIKSQADYINTLSVNKAADIVSRMSPEAQRQVTSRMPVEMAMKMAEGCLARAAEAKGRVSAAADAEVKAKANAEAAAEQTMAENILAGRTASELLGSRPGEGLLKNKAYAKLAKNSAHSSLRMAGELSMRKMADGAYAKALQEFKQFLDISKDISFKEALKEFNARNVESGKPFLDAKKLTDRNSIDRHITAKEWQAQQKLLDAESRAQSLETEIAKARASGNEAQAARLSEQYAKEIQTINKLVESQGLSKEYRSMVSAERAAYTDKIIKNLEKNNVDGEVLNNVRDLIQLDAKIEKLMEGQESSGVWAKVKRWGTKDAAVKAKITRLAKERAGFIEKLQEAKVLDKILEAEGIKHTMVPEDSIRRIKIGEEGKSSPSLIGDAMVELVKKVRTLEEAGKTTKEIDAELNKMIENNPNIPKDAHIRMLSRELAKAFNKDYGHFTAKADQLTFLTRVLELHYLNLELHGKPYSVAQSVMGEANLLGMGGGKSAGVISLELARALYSRAHNGRPAPAAMYITAVEPLVRQIMDEPAMKNMNAEMITKDNMGRIIEQGLKPDKVYVISNEGVKLMILEMRGKGYSDARIRKFFKDVGTKAWDEYHSAFHTTDTILGSAGVWEFLPQGTKAQLRATIEILTDSYIKVDNILARDMQMTGAQNKIFRNQETRHRQEIRDQMEFNLDYKIQEGLYKGKTLGKAMEMEGLDARSSGNAYLLRKMSQTIYNQNGREFMGRMVDLEYQGQKWRAPEYGTAEKGVGKANTIYGDHYQSTFQLIDIMIKSAEGRGKTARELMANEGFILKTGEALAHVTTKRVTMLEAMDLIGSKNIVGYSGTLQGLKAAMRQSGKRIMEVTAEEYITMNHVKSGEVAFSVKVGNEIMFLRKGYDGKVKLEVMGKAKFEDFMLDRAARNMKDGNTQQVFVHDNNLILVSMAKKAARNAGTEVIKISMETIETRFREMKADTSKGGKAEAVKNLEWVKGAENKAAIDIVVKDMLASSRTGKPQVIMIDGMSPESYAVAVAAMQKVIHKMPEIKEILSKPEYSSALSPGLRNSLETFMKTSQKRSINDWMEQNPAMAEQLVKLKAIKQDLGWTQQRYVFAPNIGEGLNIFGTVRGLPGKSQFKAALYKMDLSPGDVFNQAVKRGNVEDMRVDARTSLDLDLNRISHMKGTERAKFEKFFEEYKKGGLEAKVAQERFFDLFKQVMKDYLKEIDTAKAGEVARTQAGDLAKTETVRVEESSPKYLQELARTAAKNLPGRLREVRGISELAGGKNAPASVFGKNPEIKGGMSVPGWKIPILANYQNYKANLESAMQVDAYKINLIRAYNEDWQGIAKYIENKAAGESSGTMDTTWFAKTLAEKQVDMMKVYMNNEAWIKNHPIQVESLKQEFPGQWELKAAEQAVPEARTEWISDHIQMIADIQRYYETYGSQWVEPAMAEKFGADWQFYEKLGQPAKSPIGGLSMLISILRQSTRANKQYHRMSQAIAELNSLIQKKTEAELAAGAAVTAAGAAVTAAETAAAAEVITFQDQSMTLEQAQKHLANLQAGRKDLQARYGIEDRAKYEVRLDKLLQDYSRRDIGQVLRNPVAVNAAWIAAFGVIAATGAIGGFIIPVMVGSVGAGLLGAGLLGVGLSTNEIVKYGIMERLSPMVTPAMLRSAVVTKIRENWLPLTGLVAATAVLLVSGVGTASGAVAISCALGCVIPAANQPGQSSLLPTTKTTTTTTIKPIEPAGVRRLDEMGGQSLHSGASVVSTWKAEMGQSRDGTAAYEALGSILSSLGVKINVANNAKTYGYMHMLAALFDLVPAFEVSADSTVMPGIWQRMSAQGIKARQKGLGAVNIAAPAEGADQAGVLKVDETALAFFERRFSEVLLNGAIQAAERVILTEPEQKSLNSVLSQSWEFMGDSHRVTEFIKLYITNGEDLQNMVQGNVELRMAYDFVAKKFGGYEFKESDLIELNQAALEIENEAYPRMQVKAGEVEKASGRVRPAREAEFEQAFGISYAAYQEMITPPMVQRIMQYVFSVEDLGRNNQPTANVRTAGQQMLGAGAVVTIIGVVILGTASGVLPVALGLAALGAGAALAMEGALVWNQSGKIAFNLNPADAVAEQLQAAGFASTDPERAQAAGVILNLMPAGNDAQIEQNLESFTRQFGMSYQTYQKITLPALMQNPGFIKAVENLGIKGTRQVVSETMQNRAIRFALEHLVTVVDSDASKATKIELTADIVRVLGMLGFHVNMQYDKHTDALKVQLTPETMPRTLTYDSKIGRIIENLKGMGISINLQFAPIKKPMKINLPGGAA